jgi:hypothetical protein
MKNNIGSTASLDITDAISRKEKVKKEDLSNHVQSELHEIINSFLNGGFSKRGFMLYPILKDVSVQNKKKLSRLCYVLNYADRKKFAGIRDLIKNKRINDYEFAYILCEIHTKFRFCGRTSRVWEKKIMDGLKIEDYPSEDENYLNPVKMLAEYSKKRLRQHSLGFYVHGSIATKDYVKGWSDLDTLLILKKDAFSKAKNLLDIRDILYNARKFYYEIDPLQHHGTMIVTEYDLSNYPEIFLPIEAISLSKSILGEDALMKFSVRDSKKESLEKFDWVISYFQNLDEKKIKSPYDLKFALHLATLLPSLYLEAKGTFCYKKFSFEKAENDFSEEEWSGVKYAEKIRKDWKVSKKIPFIRHISKLNPLAWYMANAKYIEIGKGITCEVDRKKLISQMKIFAKKAMQNVKEAA